MSTHFEVFKSDKNSEWYWRLRAGNNQVIAVGGEGYKDKDDCLHGIDLVKRDAADAPVEDESGE